MQGCSKMHCPFFVSQYYVQTSPKRPSNTKVTMVNGPFFIKQSWFLEAPLVRQADGKLKKINGWLCFCKLANNR